MNDQRKKAAKGFRIKFIAMRGEFRLTNKSGFLRHYPNRQKAIDASWQYRFDHWGETKKENKNATQNLQSAPSEVHDLPR